MTAQRRRRTKPLKKATTQIRKKRTLSEYGHPVQWGSMALKGLTGVVLLINVVLIFFVFRQCSREPASIQESAGPPQPVPVRTMRIEVLNGCNVPKIASRYTDFLRAKGYDVVKTDNYESRNVEHSVVIDRQGIPEMSMRLAADMGIGREGVLQEVNAVYLIDATVVLGKDFRTLSSWKIMEQDGERY
ncbi:LytR C-terminal domain-containing protein [bacterium]|nr:LytR C-terminal domain-containing protein [bacterium]